jgi:hypothetical protein
MREKPIRKDFDLPTMHLGGEHYTPPKARDEQEIERRHGMPRGLLIAEQQQLGVRVAASILYLLEDKESVRFSSRLLAASGMNTAWYEFANRAEREVMRRRLKLPLLIAGRPEWRPNSEELRRDASTGFAEAAVSATKVMKAIEFSSPRKRDFDTELGRTIGKASLTTACIGLGDKVHNNYRLDDADVQMLVRRQGLSALRDARSLGTELGSNPSIAQLANPDSDLAVYWRRNAPNEAIGALTLATEAILEV